MQTKRFAAALLIAGGLAAGCAVHQTEEPQLAGPSDVATSMRVTATPDLLKLGMSPTVAGESSQVLAQVFGPDGKPQANTRLRVDIATQLSDGSWVLADCGELSARDLVTGSDGRAATVFTAPAQPPWMPQPACANFSPGSAVRIVAAIGNNNAQIANERTADIRMILPALLPMPGGMTVNFTVNPTTAKAGDEVAFTDSGSTGAAGCSVGAWDWTWSDGIKKSGPAVTHDFTPAGTYTASLLITDSCGNQGSKSVSVIITP